LNTQELGFMGISISAVLMQLLVSEPDLYRLSNRMGELCTKYTSHFEHSDQRRV